jgi:hypothetical protein
MVVMRRNESFVRAFNEVRNRFGSAGAAESQSAFLLGAIGPKKKGLREIARVNVFFLPPCPHLQQLSWSSHHKTRRSTQAFYYS